MYLYGASGHAKVIVDCVEANGQEITLLYDDNKDVKSLLDIPVVSPNNVQGPLVISIGSNKIRKKIADTLSVLFATVVHPTAIVSKRANLGVGTVVMQGAIIQSGVLIGKHAIVNTGASVDHECVLGDFVHISPHCTLCGNVTVGEGSWIGAGTTIVPGVKIGSWCVIGAGSVVTKNIPDGKLAVGNRCKIIK